jgi:hypothetical protein
VSKSDLRVSPPPRLDKLSIRSEGAMSVDIEKLQNSLEKMASTINRSASHTERIPEIQKKVESTVEKVVTLVTKMDVTTERLTKIEDRVDRGHECFQVDVISELKDSQRESSQKIETDVRKGIEQQAQIAAIIRDQSQTETDVADIKKAPRRMFYGLVSIVITILIGAGGAVWFLAELGKDVEHEQEQRVEQFKRIETQIKVVATKADTAPMRTAIEGLEAEIETSNGHRQAYDDLCQDMPRHEKRFMRRTLAARGRSLPVSCQEEK